MARWTHTSEGGVRQRSGFLLLPKTIEGETRWMERATWEERLDQGDCRDYVESQTYWTPIKWIATGETP